MGLTQSLPSASDDDAGSAFYSSVSWKAEALGRCSEEEHEELRQAWQALRGTGASGRATREAFLEAMAPDMPTNLAEALFRAFAMLGQKTARSYFSTALTMREFLLGGALLKHGTLEERKRLLFYLCGKRVSARDSRVEGGSVVLSRTLLLALLRETTTDSEVIDTIDDTLFSGANAASGLSSPTLEVFCAWLDTEYSELLEKVPIVKWVCETSARDSSPPASSDSDGSGDDSSGSGLVASLAASNLFDRIEVEQLYRIYADHKRNSPSGKVDEAAFEAIFCPPLSKELAGRMFRKFDTDENGDINLREFLSGLSAFSRGTDNSRLDMILDMFRESSASMRTISAEAPEKFSADALQAMLLSLSTLVDALGNGARAAAAICSFLLLFLAADPASALGDGLTDGITPVGSPGPSPRDAAAAAAVSGGMNSSAASISNILMQLSGSDFGVDEDDGESGDEGMPLSATTSPRTDSSEPRLSRAMSEAPRTPSGAAAADGGRLSRSVSSPMAPLPTPLRELQISKLRTQLVESAFAQHGVPVDGVLSAAQVHDWMRTNSLAQQFLECVGYLANTAMGVVPTPAVERQIVAGLQQSTGTGSTDSRLGERDRMERASSSLDLAPRLVENQYVYLLASGWWRDWLHFTERAAKQGGDSDGAPAGSPRAPGAQRPGAVDNSALTTTVNVYGGGRNVAGPIKHELPRDAFVLLTESAYSALAKWYPPITASLRVKVVKGLGPGLQPEIYPREVTVSALHLHGYSMKVVSVKAQLSITSALPEVLRLVCEAFVDDKLADAKLLGVADDLGQVLPQSNFRLWATSPSESDSEVRLLELAEHFADRTETMIADGDHLFLELRTKSGDWPGIDALTDAAAKDAKSSGKRSPDKGDEGSGRNVWGSPMKSPGSRSRAESESEAALEKGGSRSTKRKIAGISNIGNTCYMASALQCLSHSPVFGQEALKLSKTSSGEDEITPELIEVLGEINRPVTFSRGSIDSRVLRKFKDTLSERWDGARGFQQQDAQEFIGEVLDILHEENNAIEVKPYVSLETDGATDSELADMAWAYQQSRNRSVVHDCFLGQQRSVICCGVCEKTSTAFDAVSTVAVPLPVPDGEKAVGGKCRVFVVLSRLEGSRMKLALDLSSAMASTIADVKRELTLQLAMLEGAKPLPVRAQRVAELSSSRGDHSFRSIDLKDQARVFQGRTLHIFEVQSLDREQGKTHEMVNLTVVHRTLKPRPGFFMLPLQAELVGYPSLASLVVDRKLEPSEGDIVRSIWRSICHLIGRSEEALEDPQFKLEDYLAVRVVRSDGQRCAFKHDWTEPCMGCADPCSDDRSESEYMGRGLTMDSEKKFESAFLTKVTFAIDWVPDVLGKFVDKSMLSKSLPHASVAKQEAPAGKAVSILDCLEEYVTAESLTEEEAWYCSKCQEFRPFEKRLAMWRLPPLLILHMKRFKQDAYGHTRKIQSEVKFEERLDMAPYCAPDATDVDVTKYKLYAVIDHHGRYGGGHYTSCVFDKEADSWFSCNDAITRRIDFKQIVSAAAYMLFYKRVDIDELHFPLDHGPVRFQPTEAEITRHHSRAIEDKERKAARKVQREQERQEAERRRRAGAVYGNNSYDGGGAAPPLPKVTPVFRWLKIWDLNFLPKVTSYGYSESVLSYNVPQTPPAEIHDIDKAMCACFLINCTCLATKECAAAMCSMTKSTTPNYGNVQTSANAYDEDPCECMAVECFGKGCSNACCCDCCLDELECGYRAHASAVRAPRNAPCLFIAWGVLILTFTFLFGYYEPWELLLGGSAIPAGCFMPSYTNTFPRQWSGDCKLGWTALTGRVTKSATASLVLPSGTCGIGVFGAKSCMRLSDRGVSMSVDASAIEYEYDGRDLIRDDNGTTPMMYVGKRLHFWDAWDDRSRSRCGYKTFGRPLGSGSTPPETKDLSSAYGGSDICVTQLYEYNTTVTVYVNPTDPTESVLDEGVTLCDLWGTSTMSSNYLLTYLWVFIALCLTIRVWYLDRARNTGPSLAFLTAVSCVVCVSFDLFGGEHSCAIKLVFWLGVQLQALACFWIGIRGAVDRALWYFVPNQDHWIFPRRARAWETRATVGNPHAAGDGGRAIMEALNILMPWRRTVRVGGAAKPVVGAKRDLTMATQRDLENGGLDGSAEKLVDNGNPVNRLSGTDSNLTATSSAIKESSPEVTTVERMEMQRGAGDVEMQSVSSREIAEVEAIAGLSSDDEDDIGGMAGASVAPTVL